MLKELGWCSGSSSVGGIQSALWGSGCWRSPERYHLRSKTDGVLGGSILLRTSTEGISYPTLTFVSVTQLGLILYGSETCHDLIIDIIKTPFDGSELF